jgi:hypothetical protein
MPNTRKKYKICINTVSGNVHVVDPPNSLRVMDGIAMLLQTGGFVSLWECLVPLDDDIEDLVDLTFSVSADLTYSLALKHNVTLNSQFLLQELGNRLYPSIGQWMMCNALLRCYAGAAGGDDTVDADQGINV